MKLLISFLILISLISLGCDNGGGNSFSTPFVGSVDEPSVTPPPTGSGNGPGNVALFFSPANNTITVNSGDPDVIVSVAATPGGGSISLSNPTAVTNTAFVLGPGPLQFTYTCSTALAGGTASVDVTYTPPAPDFPRTIRYNIIVIFTGSTAALTLTPPSPVSVDFGTGDLLISAAVTIPGGILSLSGISANGTGATFISGPGPLEITFTSGSATTVGSESCTITYTPPPPDLPISILYTVTIVPTYVIAPVSPINVNLGSADTIVTATANPPGGTVTFANVVLGGTGGAFLVGPGSGFTFDTSATTAIGVATCDVIYTPPASATSVTIPGYTVNVGESFSTGFGFTTVSPGSTIGDTLSVPIGGTITEVRVRVDITYGFFSDLVVSITSPTTTSLNLIPSSAGSSGGGSFMFTFEDTASTTLAGITSGSYLAGGGSLDTVFGGESPLGFWTLTVTDYGGTYYSSTVLNEWAIAFNGDTSIF